MENVAVPTESLEELPAEVRLYIRYLENRISELEARLAQNSQNSSKPPSSDPPSAPPRPPKTKTGRRKGGQKGHKRHQRELVALDAVDEIKEWRPLACEKCALPLRPQDQSGQLRRHQIWEVPPVKAVVVEHQFYQAECPSCGHLTRAKADRDLPKGAFGAHLTSLVATLHGRYRLSMREIVILAQVLWQLPLSLGSVAAMCGEASSALAEGYCEATSKIAESENCHIDETGWKTAGKRRWLWVAFSRAVVVFHLSLSRGSAVIQKLVGSAYRGIIHSDRLRSYRGLALERHQLCWAHLLRNLKGLRQRAGPGEVWATTTLEWVKQLFEVWQRYRQGAISWEELGRQMEPVRAGFKSQLEAGCEVADPKVQSFSVNLLEVESCMWLFVEHLGLEPTNNNAERALRGAVIWRKTCFGTQSEAGERFVERVLTVEATCRKQGRSFVEYLKASLEMKWAGQSSPALFLA
jgi:transposase